MGRVEFASGLSIVLFIAYLGWGIYLLHIRINKHHDLNPIGEVATLGGLILFFTFEMALFQIWLRGEALWMAAAILGLAVSGIALYGPMMMSLASHALVGSIMPSGHAPIATPHHGIAEKYEEGENYDGALREYLAVAQQFPNDTLTALRVAQTLVRLERYEESIGWFERGILGIDDAEQCLVSVSRIADIAVKKIGDRDAAERVLLYFIERFPEEECTEMARRRLERVRKGEAPLPTARETETPPIRIDSDVPADELEIPEIEDEEDEEDAPRPSSTHDEDALEIPDHDPTEEEDEAPRPQRNDVSFLEDSSLGDIKLDDGED